MEQFVDLSKLERLFKNDPLLMAEWIELYLQEAPTYYNMVSEGLERNDNEAMTRALHDLRPMAHYLGSSRLFELLNAIKNMAHTNDLAACAEHVEELTMLDQVIRKELNAALIALG